LSNYNGSPGRAKNGGQFSRVNPIVLLVDWVGTISPTFVANVRANFSRYGEGWHSPTITVRPHKLGFPQSFVSQLRSRPCSAVRFQRLHRAWASR
jgi:hypothetical protein